MPVIFANEYNKYENKFGRGIFKSFLSNVSPVIDVIKNVKDIKESKTATDLDIFQRIIEETKKDKLINE